MDLKEPTVQYADAERLLSSLTRNSNFNRITKGGQLLIWFSTESPAELPIGTSVRQVSVESVPLPYGHFTTTANSLTGWMTYWWHRGPSAWGATAFVSISPNQQGTPLAHFELVESPVLADESGARYTYGLTEEFLPYFCKGLTAGLQGVISHPLADIRIRILNAIVDSIESTPKAFEVLGEMLMEAIIVEMCKRSFIERI